MVGPWAEADSRNYFRLSDGRGWVFDRSTVRGAMTQLVAPVSDDKDVRRNESRPSVAWRKWSIKRPKEVRKA